MTLEAGTPIGKYVIKRKLAEGGMAEIYLAASTGPEGFEKEVVIKRVRSFLADDEGFVRMFIEEARLASRLNHANVVQIFDFDKHEDSYYLAMEYVRGCSLWDLRKRCREKGVAVPPVLVAHIGAQVAAGLHYAHRLKGADGESLHLVHRDVTPHNVLLSLDGAVKLTDFGIAKAGNKLTQPGVLKGKFAYMSPEQARGEAVDARTDVFALGVVLWEMLTGGRLFDGDSELAVLRAVQESVIASPARLNPEVPEELDEVVAIALERDPEARFQSAGELERALAQCVLSHARSVDDTDVGTFVRRLLDAPLTQFIQMPASLMDRSQRSARLRSRTGETPSAADSTVPRASVQRESTAVLTPTGAASGRSRSVRAPPPEDSLVSASTQVLSRDAERVAETRAAPSEAPAPASNPAAPPRMAQTLPAVTSTQEAPPAKRGGKGLWVGASVGALVLIGGVVALVFPKQSAPPAPAAGPTVTATPSAQKEPVPGPEVKPEAATPPSSDAGAVVAVAPPAEPPPAQATGATGQNPPPPEPPAAPVAQARGTLTVLVTPYADVYLDNKLLKKEVQGRASFQVTPGNHVLTFKHPASTEAVSFTLEPGGKVMKTFRVRR
ncbi:serine/threonine protein kinase [Archangium lipolyticum]|uniref:serine/threonine protein kinase n=1 Tax=Archangium lipolyticum TaxID=2970465 RepID=UPI00214A01C9|nr:serine/threonine-protein kinase [Archangium lipolyticum]